MPARIWVARATVPAGKHQLNVAVRGPGGWERRRLQVDVPAGGFAAVDVTTLRSGRVRRRASWLREAPHRTTPASPTATARCALQAMATVGAAGSLCPRPTRR